MSGFKIGDKVKCIELSGGSFLQKEKIYKVKALSKYATYNGVPNIILDGNGAEWRQSRFVLARPETEEEALQTIGIRYGYNWVQLCNTKFYFVF